MIEPLYRIGNEEYTLSDLIEIGEKQIKDNIKSGIPKDVAVRLQGNWAYALYEHQGLPYVIYRTIRNQLIYNNLQTL